MDTTYEPDISELIGLEAPKDGYQHAVPVARGSTADHFASNVAPTEPEKPSEARGPKQWAFNGDIYFGAPETRNTVPAGVYRAAAAQNLGFVLLPMTVQIDSLIELPDDAGKQLLTEFETFWKKADVFKQFGMLHKRGLLMWGPPGSGKTSTLQMMVQSLVKNGGIVLYVEDPGIASGCLQLLRKIEPDRPVVVIMEDIDALIQRHGEHHYLALLDGEAQVDKVVFVATTNYPEKLDKRILNRPSRFDTIKFIGMPSADARRVYLQHRAPHLSATDIDTWVEKSDGFSVAHLREMIIATHCFDQKLDDVIKRLSGMRKTPTSSQYDDNPVGGFLSGLNGAGAAHH